MGAPVNDQPGIDAGFPGLMGTELLEDGDGRSRGRVAVGPHLLQPAGVVHGGVYAALAETLASRGTQMGVRDEGMLAFGMSNQTSFLRKVSEGHVNAEARAVHRGRTTWVWEVEMTDDEDRLCALSRVTVAVRPAARGG